MNSQQSYELASCVSRSKTAMRLTEISSKQSYCVSSQRI